MAQLDGATSKRFASDPLGVLRHDLSLKVEPAQHLVGRDDGGACDGMSFLRDGVILFAPSPHSRRQNFTLAHELGHWLINRSEAVFDWVADQEDSPRVLETLCDLIAQRLLLPESTVNALGLDKVAVRASHLVQLFETSQASRPVCAIALGRRLPGLGAVVIIDPSEARVSHSSVHPDPNEGWPVVFPWPGQSVPNGHPFNGMNLDGSTYTRRSFWRDTWGRQQDYYIDAIGDGRWVFAVFSATDLWNAEQLHLDRPPDFDERPTTAIRCCGQDRTVRGWPCPTCAEPYCPQCGLCRCQRQAQRERLCSGSCFMRYQPHLLVNGLCEECR